MTRELYLGRFAGSENRLELDPDSLVTHGVILGMTGSGKTGLALSLLEEMVQAGVPVIAIDPKGDLPNLGLLFPDFKSADFERWSDPTEARRVGLSLSELAEKKASLWREGLARWALHGQDVENLISRLDLRILTPGSRSVNPVNLLGGFSSPGPEVPEEELAEFAGGLVSGLLSLVVDNVDPLRDPRHVLAVQIVLESWAKDQTLSLEDLIAQIVDPPFAKIGVFPVDRFYSPDERMKLAMMLNSLVASPTFAPWKEGVTLDIGRLLEAPGEKTPVTIFSLAHLSEKERHFFVSRLMNEVLTWSRGLTGSSSLRALIYFDEVAGYLSPHPHNPPAKQPILTLLKQSRAVGVGVVLATQNPVDLDYKALSNMGTWMIGRLQTQQDRDRVRDGLISASGGLSAREVEAEFSKIQPRTFLLKQPNSDKPALFETRWAMSYLRGPVTLNELPQLTAGAASDSAGPSAQADPLVSKAGQGRNTPPPTPRGFGQSFLDSRYVFQHRFDGFFQDHKEPARADGRILHRLAIHAVLNLRFDESKDDFVLHQRHHFVAFPIDAGGSLAERFQSLPIEANDLLSSPQPNSLFTDLPQAFDQSEEFEQALTELVGHLHRTLTATRYVNPKVKLYSKPKESKEQFLERCETEADQMADAAAVKLRESLGKKIDRVTSQMERAKDKVERLTLTEKGQKIEGLWKAGEMLLGLFSKKRRSFSTVLGSSRRALEADTRTKQAEGELERLQSELLELQNELELQLQKLEDDHAELAEAIEEREIRLDKSDIQVERFELLWVPISSRL